MLSLPDFKEKQLIICFSTEGQKVSFSNDNLVIKDIEEKIILQATCYKIFSLWIIGNTTITTGILERSKKFGFSIFLLNYGNRQYGTWNSTTEGNFLLRKKQYEYKDLHIAKHLVYNKITNHIELLKSIRNKEAELKETIEKLNNYLEQTKKINDLQTLLGIEGSAARIYFSSWFFDIGWEGRKPRTKINELNTLLDIGYTFLFNIIECMLNLYGFDLYYGVYHRCFYQRKSLVCDIVEPFRCIIDKQIKKSYGLKQIQFDDFIEKKGQYFLKTEKNKQYTKILIQGIEHKEEIFKYVQEYYRCFMRNKPITDYPIFKII